ncbi:ribonuclease H-like domain-containing protein [Tanacetum coccineum]|uniref:Ribonuclease H-like domain-containing protein n=1 Tax=Tanacetum coccineum TaxID=301880 RepID=A0ABQ5FAK0_9ASTR
MMCLLKHYLESEEIVTKSPIRPSNNSPNDLGSSGASPKRYDATLNDDGYESEAEDFVDFSHLFDYNQDNNPEGSFLCRSSRHHKIPARLKDHGKLKYFLGVEVLETNDGLFLNQMKYCMELLSEYGMLTCKPAKAPIPLSMPDIAYAVHCLCQFMHAPCRSHLKLAFHILRYLNSSLGTGVCFKHETNLNLCAYVDSDWAKCKVIRKFVT